MPLVRFHTHWAIERIIWGTYICFTKLKKPLDKWLIKEWMIGDSVITVLSCNRPITWKSYTPHRDQGKGWIGMPTYLNCGRIFCYRHGTYEMYWHSSNSRSTTKYLAICSGWAKVKLGDLLAVTKDNIRMPIIVQNRRNKQYFDTYAFTIDIVPLVLEKTCFAGHTFEYKWKTKQKAQSGKA